MSYVLVHYRRQHSGGHLGCDGIRLGSAPPSRRQKAPYSQPPATTRRCRLKTRSKVEKATCICRWPFALSDPLGGLPSTWSDSHNGACHCRPVKVFLAISCKLLGSVANRGFIANSGGLTPLGSPILDMLSRRCDPHGSRSVEKVGLLATGSKGAKRLRPALRAPPPG